MFQVLSGHPQAVNGGPSCPAGSSSNWLHTAPSLSDPHSSTFAQCHFSLFPYQSLALNTRRLGVSSRICVFWVQESRLNLRRQAGCHFLLGTSKSAVCPLLIRPPTSFCPPGLELLEDLSLGFGHSHIALATAATSQYISMNHQSFVDKTIFMSVYLPYVCPRSEPGLYSCRT